MIDLHLHSLHVSSALGVVHVASTGAHARGIRVPAETLPDLAALLNGTRPDFTFNPLELGLTVCGVPFRKQSSMAEVLAGILRAARFAHEGSLDEVLQDAQSWKEQVQQVQLGVQEHHLRARLARLLGVQQGALSAFTVTVPIHTRSGLSTVLQGTLMGVDMHFTLEFEHLLLYVGTLSARKITKLSDLTNAAEVFRTMAVHQDQDTLAQVSA